MNPRIALPWAIALLMAPLGTTLSTLVAADDMPGMTITNPHDIKWGDAPPGLPKGAKAAVLSGDPGKPGLFTVRLRAPAGYRVPPHWHTQDENVTVISGVIYLGMGDKLDQASAKPLKAGGFHSIPAKAHHYAIFKTPTEIQINGEGPFDITYINPADNPSPEAAKN